MRLIFRTVLIIFLVVVGICLLASFSVSQKMKNQPVQFPDSTAQLKRDMLSSPVIQITSQESLRLLLDGVWELSSFSSSTAISPEVTTFTKHNESVSVSVFSGLSIVDVQRQVLPQNESDLAVVTKVPIAQFLATLVSVTNGQKFFFIPYTDERVVVITVNRAFADWEKLLTRVTFSFDPTSLKEISEYQTQENLHNIQLFFSDINGDTEKERIALYTSDDTEKNGQKRTQNHLFITESDGQVIKHDFTHSASDSTFHRVEVFDFGNDGKEEVFVEKQHASYDDLSKHHYYVFGFQNGVYQDFPIAKGYLHPEQYVDCEENDPDQGVMLSRVSLLQTGIEEDNFYFDTCLSEPVSVLLFHQYVNGQFQTKRLIGNKILDQKEKFYLDDQGFLWNEEEKIFAQPIQELVRFTGEKVFDVFTYESPEFFDLYFVEGSGCGGCVNFLAQTLRVFKKDNTFVWQDLESKGIVQFLQRPLPSQVRNNLSPDGEKVYFFSLNRETDLRELWVYDFVTQTEQRLYVFRSSEEAWSSFMPYDYADIVRWSEDSRHVIVDPLIL